MLLQNGNQRFRAGDLQGALQMYTAALDRYPAFVEALNNIGAVLGQLNRYSQALEAFERSLVIDPSDAVTLGNVALVHTLAKDPSRALEYFSRSLALDRNPRVLNNRATLYGELGSLDEALNDLSLALDLAPDDEVARFNRSGVLLAMGRHEEALRDIEILRTRFADDAAVAGRRRQILDALLRRLAKRGVISMGVGKPRGSSPAESVAPGPPLSDILVQERR